MKELQNVQVYCHFSGGCELTWGHTTDSLCVAYQGMDDNSQVIFSRLDSRIMSGNTVKIGGVYLSNKKIGR